MKTKEHSNAQTRTIATIMLIVQFEFRMSGVFRIYEKVDRKYYEEQHGFLSSSQLSSAVELFCSLERVTDYDVHGMVNTSVELSAYKRPAWCSASFSGEVASRIIQELVVPQLISFGLKLPV